MILKIITSTLLKSMKMIKNFNVLVLLLFVLNISCISESGNKSNLLSKKLFLDSKIHEIDSIKNEITQRNSNIKYYRELLLPYTINEPLELVVCVSDPNFYTYLYFYENSYFEEFYDGPGGKVIKGTWKFENDTIYCNSKEYLSPLKVSFSRVLKESKSLTSFFEYCIVDKMGEEEIKK